MKTESPTSTCVGGLPPGLETQSDSGATLVKPNVRRVERTTSVFDAGYLVRLRRGDEDTAKHFNGYFRRMLRIKLWGKFGREWQDELIDEVMAAAIQKILSGEPRNAAHLAAYVRGICTNIARKPRQDAEGVNLNFDLLSDHSLSAEDRMLQEERALMVRTVLVTLRLRDRNILVDLFYNDMDRETVCQKYGVTREQLRLLLFRARARFQEKWLKN